MTASPTSPRRAFAWTALTSLAPATWGTTYIVTTHLLPEGHPLFAALMRTLPPGLIALLVSRQLPRGSWWWRSLVLGGLNMAAFFPLLFVSAQRLPGGVAATLGAVQPLVVALLAVPVLHERLSGRRLAWGAAGVVGVALVVLGPTAALDSIGLAAGLGGALAMATGVILTKRWCLPEGVSASALAGWQLTAAGVLLALPALVLERPPSVVTVEGWLGYAWLGLMGALVSYSFWFAGIRRLPVTSTALLGLLSPLVAAALGALFAHETLRPVQVLGFAIALTALVCGQITPARRSPRSPREAGPGARRAGRRARGAPRGVSCCAGSRGSAGSRRTSR